jgi:GDP-4-dehydro-6-deoxy-D-mannose reductase
MKVLITGISGFVGGHLAELLLNNRDEVHGIIMPKENIRNIRHIAKNISLYTCDLRNKALLEKLIKKIRPGRIYHLAAQSSVKGSWDSPASYYGTNVLSTINILDAVKGMKNRPVILLVGSGEEYGKVKRSELPIKETHKLMPQNPYAASKMAQEYFGLQYHKNFGIKVILVRMFNLTGPRRSDVFADSSFAKQIALIEKGTKKPVILVGDLGAARDFTDVRDAAVALHLALEKGKPGEAYNICSGKAVKIGLVLDKLVRSSKVKIKVVCDPQRMRRSDVPVIAGSSAKLRNRTGWKPAIQLNKSLQDLLEYWRKEL